MDKVIKHGQKFDLDSKTAEKLDRQGTIQLSSKRANREIKEDEEKQKFLYSPVIPKEDQLPNKVVPR